MYKADAALATTYRILWRLYDQLKCIGTRTMFIRDVSI